MTPPAQPPRKDKGGRPPSRGKGRAGRPPTRRGRPWQPVRPPDEDLEVTAWHGSRSEIVDPLTGQAAERRSVQPVAATKEYVCPGCNQEIRRGTGHVVVVPAAAPDMRRHWHTPCLERALRHGLR